MIRSKGTAIRMVGLVGFVTLATSCGSVPDPVAGEKDKETEGGGDDPAEDKTVVDGSTVVLSGTLALSGTGLTGMNLVPTLDSIVMFCVTFEETPRVAKSDFDATGKFSLSVPKGVNFGCFVNDRATGRTLASVVVEAAAGSFGSGQSSMALGGSLDLGALTIGEDGTIKISQAVLANAAAKLESAINVDEMHNSEYAMNCQDAGDADASAKCKEEIMDGGESGTVFLRILKGKHGDSDVVAMGVWKDKASFDACGGFDMSQAEVDKLGTEAGVALTQVTVGAFAESEACIKRYEGEIGRGNIKTYYALSQLTPNGAGFSFRADDEDHGGGENQGGDQQQGVEQQGVEQPDQGKYLDCQRRHVTGIEFSGTAAILFGAFSSSESASGQPGCSEQSSINSFSVKFTKK